MATLSPIKRILLRLNAQILDLTTAKRVLEELDGGTNGHRAAATMMSNLEVAMDARHAQQKAAAARPKKTYKAGAHWTQTPAGRKKMAKHMKRRMKAAKAAGSSVVLPDPK